MKQKQKAGGQDQCLPGPLPCFYTVRLFRPLARRRLRTRLPPLVAIRTRKPWVLFLFVLLNAVKFFFIYPSPVQCNKLLRKP
jgi:hypothetical protein